MVAEALCKAARVAAAAVVVPVAMAVRVVRFLHGGVAWATIGFKQRVAVAVLAVPAAPASVVEDAVANLGGRGGNGASGRGGPNGRVIVKAIQPVQARPGHRSTTQIYKLVEQRLTALVDFTLAPSIQAMQISRSTILSQI